MACRTEVSISTRSESLVLDTAVEQPSGSRGVSALVGRGHAEADREALRYSHLCAKLMVRPKRLFFFTLP